jgi:hypothetical protein
MKPTTNHYAHRATTIRQHTMAAVGVGGLKSLGLGGIDRRGQSCALTREIRQGGG